MMQEIHFGLGNHIGGGELWGDDIYADYIEQRKKERFWPWLIDLLRRVFAK